MFDPLLVMDEVADEIRTTRAGLYAMVHRGDAPPSFRVGKRRVFPRSALEQWKRERLQAETGQAVSA